MIPKMDKTVQSAYQGSFLNKLTFHKLDMLWVYEKIIINMQLKIMMS